jgi:hypothetical protein
MTPAHFIPDKLIISQITFPEICMNAIGRMNMTRVVMVVIVWLLKIFVHRDLLLDK